MDTSFYFIRCKGEERGPFAFYQIQQMRTDDVLTRDHFTPEEWEQFEQFLDDGGDVPRPRNGMAAIRRADKGEKQRKERGLMVALTYLTYAMAGFVLLAAMIQGEQDYVLQSKPMFWLGLFCAVALCHTLVDRLCRRQLMRYPRSSRLDLFVKYFLGLFLLGLAVGGLYSGAKYFPALTLDKDAILAVGKKFMVAAAIVSFYRPFYLGFMAEHNHLGKQTKASGPWLTILLGFVVMLVLYLAPTSGLNYPAVISMRERVFTVETAAVEGDASDWKFPVRLGDSQKAVQRVLGKPQISGRDYVYHSLRLSFDQQSRVTRLHFDGRELYKSIFAKKLLLAGLTPAGSLQQMKTIFGGKNVTFGDQNSETHVWELSGYRVAACFWTGRTSADLANKVKWLDISATQ